MDLHLHFGFGFIFASFGFIFTYLTRTIRSLTYRHSTLIADIASSVALATQHTWAGRRPSVPTPHTAEENRALAGSRVPLLTALRLSVRGADVLGVVGDEYLLYTGTNAPITGHDD